MQAVIPAASAPAPLLQLTLFGRCRAALGEHPVVWLRRKEQQIVQYVALTRDARASREELIRAFWAGVPPGVGARSLRTACSNIRKALAAAAGPDAPDRYFTCRGDVAFVVDNLCCDARRFREHVVAADAALLADWHDAAFAHYANAARLFAVPLLSGEDCSAPFDGHASRFDEAMATILRRLIELARERGDDDLVRSYGERIRRHALERSEPPANPMRGSHQQFGLAAGEILRRSA